MAVIVNLTFDTIEQMLSALSGVPSKNISSQCCLGPDDGREPFTTPMNAVPAPMAPIDHLVDALNDPKYTVRTMGTLREKAGLFEDADVFNLLDKYSIAYFTKTRRRDGETLIGLSDR
jgi:hypothetical protein